MTIISKVIWYTCKSEFLQTDSPQGATTEPQNRAFQQVRFLNMDSPEGATVEPRNIHLALFVSLSLFIHIGGGGNPNVRIRIIWVIPWILEILCFQCNLGAPTIHIIGPAAGQTVGHLSLQMAAQSENLPRLQGFHKQDRLLARMVAQNVHKSERGHSKRGQLLKRISDLKSATATTFSAMQWKVVSNDVYCIVSLPMKHEDLLKIAYSHLVWHDRQVDLFVFL